MRKVISIFVAVVLVCGLLATTAFADDTQITVSSATAAPGETVTISVDISGNPGFAATKFTVVYDSNVLTITDMTADLLASGVVNAAKGIVSFASATNVTDDGNLFTVTFAVADNAANGTYPVTVEIGRMNAADKSTVSYTLTGGSVTVETCGAGHTFGDWTQTTAPTCTEKGAETRTCSACDATETREIAATGHSYGEWKVTTAATCTEKGVETRTCSACGATETRDIAATGHSYGEWKVTTAATCTEKGVETRTCACGATETRDIAATGVHTYGEWTETKAPTCTAKGTKIRTCTVCNNATETSDVPALGHTPSADSVIEKAPTCEEEGLATGSCSVCGEKLTNEVIAALGHSYDDVVVTAPTCTEDGYTTYTCSVCENSYIGDETDALGHDYVVTETVDPTCEDDGHETSVCSRCEDTTTKTLPATGHTYESFEQTETGHIGTCACGDVAEEEAHEYSINGDVLVKPTTTTEGQQEMLCVCGAKTVVTLDKLTAELDDVPKTGDITGELAMGAMVIVAMFAAVAFVFKRKAAK